MEVQPELAPEVQPELVPEIQLELIPKMQLEDNKRTISNHNSGTCVDKVTQQEAARRQEAGGRQDSLP